MDSTKHLIDCLEISCLDWCDSLVESFPLVNEDLQIILLLAILVILILIIWSIRKIHGLTQDRIRELRRSRRKNPTIEIITNVIDPLSDEVERFEDVLTQAKNGSFRQFTGDWNYNGGAWSDFCEEESYLIDSVREYMDIREVYKKRYNDLVDLLAREVRDMNPSGLRRVLEKVMDNHNVKMDKRDFLEENSEDIAKSILVKEPLGADTAKSIYRRWKSEFIFLRQKSNISDEIGEFKEFVGGIESEFLDSLIDELENVRTTYKDMYCIYESEVEEAS